MGRDGVYTPQVVVNGRVEGDGLEPGELSGLVSRGDRGAGGPNVGFSGGAVTVGAGARRRAGRTSGSRAYIPRTVEVAIPRGENAGHTLPYKDVVREMVLIGHWHGEAATFPAPGAGDPGLAEAAIVQGAGCGPILAAARDSDRRGRNITRREIEAIGFARRASCRKHVNSRMLFVAGLLNSTRSGRESKLQQFFLKFLDRKQKVWHSEQSLDERRLERADGKRPLPPRMAKPKG